MISVTGRLAHDAWESKTGEKRQRHYVVASDVEFLDARPNGVQPEATAASRGEDDIPF